MRKKIIAAAAVQIAAALLLLTVSPLWAFALEKYGTEYTVNSTSVWCDGSYTDEDGHFMFCVECEKQHVDGLEHPVSEYVDITDDSLIYLYASGSKSNVRINMTYYIKDTALSEKLSSLYNYDTDNMDAFELADILNLRSRIVNTVYSVKIKVFGSRVKLISVTADGKELETYLSELLGA